MHAKRRQSQKNRSPEILWVKWTQIYADEDERCRRDVAFGVLAKPGVDVADRISLTRSERRDAPNLFRRLGLNNHSALAPGSRTDLTPRGVASFQTQYQTEILGVDTWLN